MAMGSGGREKQTLLTEIMISYMKMFYRKIKQIAILIFQNLAELSATSLTQLDMLFVKEI